MDWLNRLDYSVCFPLKYGYLKGVLSIDVKTKDLETRRIGRRAFWHCFVAMKICVKIYFAFKSRCCVLTLFQPGYFWSL